MSIFTDKRKEIDFDIDKAVKGLFERAISDSYMQNYFGLFLYFAIAKHAKTLNDDKLLSKIKEILDLYPDGIEHPRYSFLFNKYGSIGKAYLTMTGDYPDFKEEIRYCAEDIYSRLTTDDGILCYDNISKGKWIWVDSIAFVAPFMVYAGHIFNEPRYYVYAAKQCIRMYDALVDESCGLVHQSRGFIDGKQPYLTGEDHWSRGNGWMMAGFAELIEHLPRNCPLYGDVLSRYIRFCDAIVKTQSPRGLWRQDMALPDSWEDSTGSGIISYGLGVGIRVGVLKDECYKKAFEKSIWGLCTHCITEDYHTYHGCEGCQSPPFRGAIGSVEAYVMGCRAFRDEHHSYGCIILALTEACLYGMKTVKRLQQKENTVGL